MIFQEACELLKNPSATRITEQAMSAWAAEVISRVASLDCSSLNDFVDNGGLSSIGGPQCKLVGSNKTVVFNLTPSWLTDSLGHAFALQAHCEASFPSCACFMRLVTDPVRATGASVCKDHAEADFRLNDILGKLSVVRRDMAASNPVYLADIFPMEMVVFLGDVASGMVAASLTRGQNW